MQTLVYLACILCVYWILLHVFKFIADLLIYYVLDPIREWWRSRNK